MSRDNSAEKSISVPDLDKLIRISEEHYGPFYLVFTRHMKNSPVMTKQIRTAILNDWSNLCPSIPHMNLRNYLIRLEKKYWASIPKWEQSELINKITAESISMQEDVMDATSPQSLQMAKTKALTVDKLNETIARVNKLESVPPAPTFIINTNTNPQEMLAGLNTIEGETNE